MPFWLALSINLRDCFAPQSNGSVKVCEIPKELSKNYSPLWKAKG
jgi:hypothetical protein